jgi:tripartite-type tricarboxylate transporter receptor subunit TctC
MATERLNKLFGMKVTYVPFKGTGDLSRPCRAGMWAVR